MNLTLEKVTQDQNLEDFISNFLLQEIVKEFEKQLEPQALEPISEYVNSPDILRVLKVNPEEEIHIDLRKAAIAAIQHLVYENTPNAYIISIDPNESIPKITAKLIDIASLINYGSMMSPAYPIYDRVFSYVADNIQEYYNIYILGD